MIIPLDQKKFKRARFVIYVGIILLIFFYVKVIYDVPSEKKFPIVLAIVIPTQLFPLILMLKRFRLLKENQDCVISLENGYLTDLTRVWFPIRDFRVEDIRSIGKIQTNKGNRSFSIKFDKNKIAGGLFKRLVLRKIRINEMVISHLDFNMLHDELESQLKKKNLPI